MKGNKRRIAIVHRDQVVCDALKNSISTVFPDSEVSAIGCNSVVCISSKIKNFDPEVLVLNISGFDFSSVLSYLNASPRDLKILVCGLCDCSEDVVAVIRAGAVACETIGASLVDLIVQVEALCQDRSICSPNIGRILFEQASSKVKLACRRNNNGQVLTSRELEVVALIEMGMSNKMIAKELSIGLQTVKNHVHNILEKLQLSRRTEAARYARENGILSNKLV